MQKRGTTNLGLRVESMVGMLSWIVSCGLGGKLPLTAFTPHLQDAVEAASPAAGGGNTLDLTTAKPEEVFAMFTRLATQTAASKPPKDRPAMRPSTKKIRTFTPDKK